MIDVFKRWYLRNFANPQTVILALILVVGIALVIVMSKHLMPILVSIVIAYLFEGTVQKLGKIGINRTIAASLMTAMFLTMILLLFLVLLPLLSAQISDLFRELPGMLGKGQNMLAQLPQRYPDYVSEQQVNELLSIIRSEITSLGQQIVTTSLSSVVSVITFFVYLILLPLMLFFFLKDKGKILYWLSRFLPNDMELVRDVWAELNIKIASYVRGKFMEIAIVWVSTYIGFALMGLNYAMLLSLLVGLSVIIPYVGATVVTIPVMLIAFFQFGSESMFGYVMLIYAIIQFLDGNLLVPLLFSEVVNLHPVAIIVAVVFFGSLWGVWGVFFAIPLATLVQAVLNVWPSQKQTAAQ
ncbi:MAG: AI-2E family transporter [Gammaproteobacteria bacterium]|nr:AI-2E family transporter [Gammaproteobacteria bacterium]MBL6998755.1 AI-2E family transporter [Gammaproteobacteria bacterium]